MSPHPADVIMGSSDEEPTSNVAFLNGSRALEASLYLSSQKLGGVRRPTKLLQPLPGPLSQIQGPQISAPVLGAIDTRAMVTSFQGGNAAGKLNPLKRPLLSNRKATVLPPLSEQRAPNLEGGPLSGRQKLGEGQKKMRLAEELQHVRKPRVVRPGSGGWQQPVTEERAWFGFLSILNGRLA
jgi:hypothetical protein